LETSPPSLKKRYAAKLAANLVGFGINLIIYAIIPRGLGPKAYGDFSFLSNFFIQLMPFFSMSTSTCFYIKISQRQDEFSLVSFYFQLTALAFIALFFFVAVCHILGLNTLFWMNQDMHYVYMAVVFAMLTWIIQIFYQLADAYGLTVTTELAKIVQRFVGLGTIIVLFLSNQLNLNNFFLYHYSILLLLIFLLIWIIAGSKRNCFRQWRLTFSQIKKYSSEFYHYSHPLFLYTLIGVFVGILDRWLLQKFSGSVEQGYFGLAYQIGAVCFLFTSAMTSLITREFSIAHAAGDRKEMARLFRTYIPVLYSIAAFFGCFASVQAAKITYIFGGNSFAAAATPVMIMALYPIHQTYGQLSGSVFYATGQTALYRNIGMIYYALSLPMAYFLLAPSDSYGLNAGAVGLAAKFFLVNFIIVNVQLYFNSRYLNLQFFKYLGHQIFCAGCLIGFALLARIAFDLFFGLQDYILVSFIASGFFYTALVAVTLWFFPIIFGLKNDDIKKMVNAVTRLLTHKQAR
jgi:O-antigen/teichoic acid export membrane protein